MRRKMNMFQWISKTKTQKRTKGGRDNLSDIERVQDNNHKKKKMLNKLRRRMDEHKEKFNKELEI